MFSDHEGLLVGQPRHSDGVDVLGLVDSLLGSEADPPGVRGIRCVVPGEGEDILLLGYLVGERRRKGLELPVLVRTLEEEARQLLEEAGQQDGRTGAEQNFVEDLQRETVLRERFDEPRPAVPEAGQGLDGVYGVLQVQAVEQEQHQQHRPRPPDAGRTVHDRHA